jgi:hypothetical protein
MGTGERGAPAKRPWGIRNAVIKTKRSGKISLWKEVSLNILAL